MTEIKCHNGQMFADVHKPVWNPPNPLREPCGTPFKTCSYCGSINPEDLLGYLESFQSITMECADWKYGYPHKFYVYGIPNPLAGKQVKIGSSCRNGISEDTMGKASADAFTKFYSTHLLDCSDKLIDSLSTFFLKHSNIEFVRKPEGLAYLVRQQP